MAWKREKNIWTKHFFFFIFFFFFFFCREWEKEIGKLKTSGKPSLLRAILRVVWKRYFGWLFMALVDVSDTFIIISTFTKFCLCLSFVNILYHYTIFLYLFEF